MMTRSISLLLAFFLFRGYAIYNVIVEAFVVPRTSHTWTTRKIHVNEGALKKKWQHGFHLRENSWQASTAQRHSQHHRNTFVESQRLRVNKRRRLVVVVAILFWVCFCRLGIQPAVAAAAATSDLLQKQAPATQKLGIQQLGIAAGLAMSVGGLGTHLTGLTHLSQQVLSACMRCTIQLFLVGALILSRLFGTTKPAIVMAWIVGVGCIASYEAWSRVEYTYPKFQQHVLVSVLCGGLSVVGIALWGRVLGTLQPWYQPRTLIPVCGMVFGNTLSAATLGANALTREFALRRDQVELRLARGATSDEAALPHVRSALTTALTPTINSLSITGIVHMPGMMTGQILAGQSPRQASAYQVAILFMITASASAMVLILNFLVRRTIFDASTHRLSATNLVPVDRAKQDKETSTTADTNSKRASLLSRVTSVGRLAASIVGIRLSNNKRSVSIAQPDEPTPLVNETTPSKLHNRGILTASPINESGKERNGNVTDTSNKPVLIVDKLLVERPNNLVFAFKVYKGDRIGITGVSGIGKTQLLRSIAGLDGWNTTSDGSGVSLDGKSSTSYSLPQWRRQVCWIPQDRPTLDGTPRDFYNQVRNYKSQRDFNHTTSPEDYCREWNLDAAALDQPWATLSGGEAQRASLAIALCLNAKVLLLDESMGALDKDTATKVEETLEGSGIPIVLVTHSKEQLDRFCTHQLKMIID